MALRRNGELLPDPPNQKPKTLKRYEDRKGVPLANATVDNERVLLRAIINWADEVSEKVVPSIRWGKLALSRAEKQRLLKYDEQEKLFTALDEDLREVVEFDIASGLRLRNAMHLKWEQVDWLGERLVFRTKSKKEGGEFHYLPMTARIKAILQRHLGRHPEYVFTYKCRHTAKVFGVWRYAGQYYPFSDGGWRKQWHKALKAAGLWDKERKSDNFRFHDIRHTTATRTLEATNDLYLVQRLLGHANITTTQRYAKLARQTLLAGMEKTDDKSQEMSQSLREVRKPKEDGHV